jgi:hypothetical protein
MTQSEKFLTMFLDQWLQANTTYGDAPTPVYATIALLNRAIKRNDTDAIDAVFDVLAKAQEN